MPVIQNTAALLRENLILTEIIYVLNGPNLNLMGLREPEIYGYQTLEDIKTLCSSTAKEAGFSIRFFQSNIEGVLIDQIQDARQEASAIVINPAAYSHTSIAILDALKSFTGPVAEVHISNVHQRESFRHHSYISSHADCIIIGCGIIGYRFAIEFLVNRLKKSNDNV
ncbi:MAG: 3-dehydroquinate dehydratase II [Candidatus Tokpelaia sp. JSC188]|nr:MAG: 3-dehydroquinate dehydratase II [Candidatus Tokpelaia sp. JSC188]